MKEGLVHLCFVIDESGSMYNSVSDVVGGFQKFIDDQKADKGGECIVSLYTFNGRIIQRYLGKDVNEIESLVYRPGGSTALFDAIGTAIDQVGEWLADMKEEDRPIKNMIIIMTDGEENSSMFYSTAKVREMIEHQTNKYDWDFVYMGTDLADFDDADSIGINTRSLSGRDHIWDNYVHVSNYASSMKNARCAEARVAAYATLDSALTADTQEYLTTNS